jgi:hypothetical protein
VWLLWGRTALFTALLCLGSGMGIMGVIYGLLRIIDWFVRKQRDLE